MSITDILGMIVIIVLYFTFAAVISLFLKDIFSNQKKGNK